MPRSGQNSTSKGVGRGWGASTGATHDGDTGSLRVLADLPVSLTSRQPLASRQPLLCEGQRQEGLCNPRSSRTPSLPYPCVPSAHLGLKWVGFSGGGRGRVLHARTQGYGGGAGPGGQRVWTGGHSARPEETVAQCPASPRRTVGSCSQTAPHDGNPNSISAPLTPQWREKPQPRGSLPAWVTQHLSHSGNTHGRPPGPAQQGGTKPHCASGHCMPGASNSSGREWGKR